MYRPFARLLAGLSLISACAAQATVFTFDTDPFAGTPVLSAPGRQIVGAGNAANLIAGHMATSGPGFFVYFNQSLDLPRLAHSSDLASTTSDIRILARILNLNGQTGRDALPRMTAADFEFVDHGGNSVPEPATALLVLSAVGLCAAVSRRRARR